MTEMHLKRQEKRLYKSENIDDDDFDDDFWGEL